MVRLLYLLLHWLMGGRSIPLAILTVDEGGKATVDKSAVLDTQEAFFKINTRRPFKLNAGIYGVCTFYTSTRQNPFDMPLLTDRVLYPNERLAKITTEAAKGDGIFLLNDRIGLVHDAMALAKSGHATVSSALTVVNLFEGGESVSCLREIT